MPRTAVARNEAARTRLLGALLLAGIAIFLTLAYVRPNPFSHETTVHAVFRNVGNVGVVPVEVRMAGAAVGKVTDKRRVGDYALVTMELDPDAGTVYRDARARLRPRLAFEGTAFIELDPGHPGAGRLGDGRIPASRTENAVALDQALRVARPGTREAIRRDVRELGAALGPDAQRGLQETLRSGPQLTRDLESGARAAQGSTRTELTGVVKGFADTAEGVQREERSIAPLLRGADRTLAALNVDGDAPLERTVAELPARLAGISRGSRALRGVIDRLDPLAVDLRPGLERLTPTLRRTRPLLREARPVFRRAPALVRDLRGALDAGGASTPQARVLLRRVDRLARLLNGSLLPTLLAPTRFGIPTYRQFLILFQGGAGAFGALQSDATSDPRCKGPAIFDPTCQRLGNGHFARFGAIFDIARPPVLPCDPRKTHCSPQQDKEAKP